MSACKSFPTDTKTAVVSSTTVHTFTSWSMSTIVPSASCVDCSPEAGTNSLTSIPHLYESTAVVDSTFTTTLYGSSCSGDPSKASDPSHPTADSGASDGNAHSTLIVTRTETVIGRPVQSSPGGLLTSTFHSGAVTLTEYEPALQTASSAGALSHSSESYLGRIIGSVVGAVSGIILIGCLFYYCSRRKQTGLSSEQVSVLAEAGAFQKRGSSEPKPYDYGRVGSPPLTTAVSPLEYPASVIHSHHHSGDDPGDYFAPSLARSSTLTSHATFLAPERSLSPSHWGLYRNGSLSSSHPSSRAASEISNGSTDPLMAHLPRNFPPPIPDTSPTLPPGPRVATSRVEEVAEDTSDAESVVLERPRNVWRITNPDASQLYHSSTEALENEARKSADTSL